MRGLFGGGAGVAVFGGAGLFFWEKAVSFYLEPNVGMEMPYFSQ